MSRLKSTTGAVAAVLPRECQFRAIPTDTNARQKNARAKRRILIGIYYNDITVIGSREASAWGKLLGDVVIVAPLLDRLYHHGHMLRFEGKSWRLHQAALRHAAGGQLRANHVLQSQAPRTSARLRENLIIGETATVDR